MQNGGPKHSKTRYHFIRENVIEALIKLAFVPTKEVTAKALSSHLTSETFTEWFRELGLRNGYQILVHVHLDSIQSPPLTPEPSFRVLLPNPTQCIKADVLLPYLQIASLVTKILSLPKGPLPYILAVTLFRCVGFYTNELSRGKGRSWLSKKSVDIRAA